MKKIKEIFMHVCMICSVVCITAKVLDWYNPYMDFSGHILFIQIILYFGVIFLAVTEKYEDEY